VPGDSSGAQTESGTGAGYTDGFVPAAWAARLHPLDNGAEFTGTAVREWLERLEVKTVFIATGSAWEYGYDESLNGKLRDELLDGEFLYTLQVAKLLVGEWRAHFNTIRPHSSLGYRPPAPQTINSLVMSATAGQQ
jgi:transposase InsO family protein